MKRVLNKIRNLESALKYFDADGNETDKGNLTGDVNWLRGDVSGLRGNVSGLTGYVDDCEIRDKERRNGVKVSDLVEEK